MPKQELPKAKSKTDSLVAARKKEVQQARAKTDSIAKVRREEIVAKKDSIMRRNAAASGQDLDTYKKEAQALAKKKSAASCSTNSMSRDGKKTKPVKTGCRY
jgi:hypothetical protein